MTIIEKIRESLKKRRVDGWLFYSFRHSDPFASRILKFKEAGHATRRWFYFIPAFGTPVKIVHKIEKNTLNDLPGDTLEYLSWQELDSALAKALSNRSVVAMQYSPNNEIPYVSVVDAGTVESVKSKGKTIVSSAELIQEFEAALTEEQMLTHKAACEILRGIVDVVFKEVARRVRDKVAVSEYDIQILMLSLFKKKNLITSSSPVAAVNESSADPHYESSPERAKPIKPGDFLLIDLWGKLDLPGSIYGDITWTGYLGDVIPDAYASVFKIVAEARDSAFSLLKNSFSKKESLCGWQVDDCARNVIGKAGYGEYFIHRTGHSIGEEVHGAGVMIDNLETRDSRHISSGCCFSLEPGIYLPGKFGIRTEIDVFMSSEGPMCFGAPIQTEIVKII